MKLNIDISDLGSFRDPLPVLLFIKRLEALPNTIIKVDTSSERIERASQYYGKNVLILIKTHYYFDGEKIPISFEADVYFDSEIGIREPFVVTTFVNNKITDAKQLWISTLFRTIEFWQTKPDILKR